MVSHRGGKRRRQLSATAFAGCGEKAPTKLQIARDASRANNSWFDAGLEVQGTLPLLEASCLGVGHGIM